MSGHRIPGENRFGRVLFKSDLTKRYPILANLALRDVGRDGLGI